MKSARLFLAHLLSERGATAEACAWLLEVHALDPTDPQLAASVATLAQRAPQDPAVRELLSRLGR